MDISPGSQVYMFTKSISYSLKSISGYIISYYLNSPSYNQLVISGAVVIRIILET